MKLTRFIVLIGALLISLPVLAEDWPQWRGPHFNGSSSEKNLPSTWTKADAIWVADMPGPSAGTPVILGDHVFVSSVDKAALTLQALCLDRKTGKILWNKKAGDARPPDGQNATLASPSPVADANRVFFFYGEGTLTAFDHAGKELWSRSITKEYGTFAFQWTFSATPMLHGGKLYVQVLQRNVQVNGRGRPDGPNDSYLLAIDPSTGKTLWRHIRPSDARAESLEAYSTPIPFEHKGRKEILITGGDCITGHDPETGKELWRWATWNPTKITHWRLVPSPVTGGGVVLACAPKNDPVYAFKVGLSGTVDDSAIVWKSQKPEVTADVPTPLFYDGDFFILRQDRPVLSRVEPATGNVKWTVAIPGGGKYEGSPTGADGKIYMMNFPGNVTVVDAAKGEILSTISMAEPGDNHIRSTISVARGQLFIRTNSKLFCIAKK